MSALNYISYNFIFGITDDMAISTDSFHAQFQAFNAVLMSCSSAGMLSIKSYAKEINQQNTASIQVTYRDEPIQEEMSVKFLGLEMDNDRNWKTPIGCMLPILKSACYVIRCFKHYSTIGTFKMIYHAYFHSAMVYGIIFWGNSVDSNKIFLQQKRIVRAVFGINPQST